MAQAAKSRKTLRKLAKVARARKPNKCANRRPGKRNGPLSFLTEKKVTYHRDVAKERKQLKASALAERKERLAIQQLRAKEKTAEAAILAAEKKIAAAEKGIDTAAKKAKGGGMSEAQFEAAKARLKREIEAQEKHKAKVQSANPSWGFGIYQGTGFTTRQVAHFKSKPAAETYARSHGLKDYSIKRAFAKNPAVSGPQYRLAQAVLSGTQRISSMPKKVAQEIVDSTPAKLRSEYMKSVGGSVNGIIPSTGGTKAKKSRGQANRGSSKKKKQSKRNPEDLAAKLSEKFHGRPAHTLDRVVEKHFYPDRLTKLGDLVRLVIDTPTGIVAALNFNVSDPKKIVHLAAIPVKNGSGKVIAKQLVLAGGDQEVNLKALGMDSPEWIRDKMELGRLHDFPKSAKEGSLVYQTKKRFNNFKLTDWWHRAGEESQKAVGPAARPLVVYDHRNKHLEIVGGQYHVSEPGIIN